MGGILTFESNCSSCSGGLHAGFHYNYEKYPKILKEGIKCCFSNQWCLNHAQFILYWIESQSMSLQSSNLFDADLNMVLQRIKQLELYLLKEKHVEIFAA